jgi:hypothetical protein
LRYPPEETLERCSKLGGKKVSQEILELLSIDSTVLNGKKSVIENPSIMIDIHEEVSSKFT